MSDTTQDNQMDDSSYEHGEELLLGGAKKLAVVSLRTDVFLSKDFETDYAIAFIRIGLGR
jgi:hypothetical protein